MERTVGQVAPLALPDNLRVVPDKGICQGTRFARTLTYLTFLDKDLVIGLIQGLRKLGMQEILSNLIFRSYPLIPQLST